jgi:hypothetical protein
LNDLNLKMSKPTINQLVRKHGFAFFDFYRQGHFYYHIAIPNRDDEMGTPERWQFNIPADDIGTATLSRTEKAITLMRWIRKALDSGELINIKNG